MIIIARRTMRGRGRCWLTAAQRLAGRCRARERWNLGQPTQATSAKFALGLLIMSCLHNGGCSVIGETHHVAFLARRTTQLEPRLFRFLRNGKESRGRNAAIASEVWHEVFGDCPDDFSEHYARGFMDGFADYMYRGGSGEAPLLPPRDYWNLGYESPLGRQQIQDWYDGFRHGTSECIARGYRDLVVIPSSNMLGPAEMIGSALALPPDPDPAEIIEAPEPAIDRDRLIIPNDGTDLVPAMPVDPPAPESTLDFDPAPLDD